MFSVKRIREGLDQFSAKGIDSDPIHKAPLEEDIRDIAISKMGKDARIFVSRCSRNKYLDFLYLAVHDGAAQAEENPHKAQEAQHKSGLIISSKAGTGKVLDDFCNHSDRPWHQEVWQAVRAAFIKHGPFKYFGKGINFVFGDKSVMLKEGQNREHRIELFNESLKKFESDPNNTMHAQKPINTQNVLAYPGDKGIRDFIANTH